MKTSSTIAGAYLEITKPGIIVMVLVTVTVGYVLASQNLQFGEIKFWLTLVGTALTAGGAGALNSCVEREPDSRMDRTRFRPLPQKKITPLTSALFGLTLTLAGVFILQTGVNLLTSFLSLLTVFLYILVYTPLKKITWLNTLAGSIPGALPILMGWTAASGALSLYAWLLFLILFAWQHPHFYAIAWMYKDDYARGGFRMLPVIDPTGKRTFFHVIFYSLLLLVFSILPVYFGLTGWIYLGGVLVLGLLVFAAGVAFVTGPNYDSARRLLRATLIYFPLLLLLVLIDKR